MLKVAIIIGCLLAVLTMCSMARKLKFMFGNKALTYVSTEGDLALRQFAFEQNATDKKKKGKKTVEKPGEANKNQEEFEAMKNKTKKLLVGMIAVIVAAIAGVIVYKNMH